jgi:hypothetical protein
MNMVLPGQPSEPDAPPASQAEDSPSTNMRPVASSSSDLLAAQSTPNDNTQAAASNQLTASPRSNQGRGLLGSQFPSQGRRQSVSGTLVSLPGNDANVPISSSMSSDEIAAAAAGWQAGYSLQGQLHKTNLNKRNGHSSEAMQRRGLQQQKQMQAQATCSELDPSHNRCEQG